MHASKITTVATLLLLSLLLGLGAGCALVLRHSGDELRRQQSGSETFATGTRSREGDEPWRAIVHTAGYDAADGLVDGTLDALDDPERKQQIEELGDAFETRLGSSTSKAGEDFVAGINGKLPETEAVLATLVQRLRKELAIDPERTGRAFVRGAIAEARTGVGQLRPQVRAMVEEDVVGVVRQALDEALGPKLKARVRDHVKPAIDELGVPQLAEDVGRRAARGFSAEMAESLGPGGSLGVVIDHRIDQARDVAGEATDVVDRWLARGLLIALVVAVIVIVLVVVWWLRERNERVEAERARKAAAEAEAQRERMLRLVASAIHRAGQRDDLRAFREEMKRLSREGDGREAAAGLSQFLVLEGLKLDAPRG